MQKPYTIKELQLLMKKLRDPIHGCPWDKKQSYESIAPCTIEEAYEVVDAITKKDFTHLKEELGDLLFQVVFYAQLGDEDNYFDLDDIISTLTGKLIRRHPHVFPDGDLYGDVGDKVVNEQQVKENWETIKQTERNNKGNKGLLDDIPTSLPALTRAQKLQKRAAKQGFDWRDSQEVMLKLHEEVAELQAEIETDASNERILEELGDVFFTCANLARYLGADSESIIRKANAKFERRFKFIECHALKPLNQLSIDELNQLWEKSKK